MSTKGSSIDDRINKAVAAAKKHPTLSVPEAMLMGGFSQKQISADKEENGRNLHQQVYKRVGKREDTRRALSRSRKGPSRKEPSGVVSLKSPESLVSSVTFSTPPKAKQITKRTSEQIA